MSFLPLLPPLPRGERRALCPTPDLVEGIQKKENMLSPHTFQLNACLEGVLLLCHFVDMTFLLFENQWGSWDDRHVMKKSAYLPHHTGGGGARARALRMRRLVGQACHEGDVLVAKPPLYSSLALLLAQQKRLARCSPLYHFPNVGGPNGETFTPAGGRRKPAGSGFTACTVNCRRLLPVSCAITFACNEEDMTPPPMCAH